MLSRDERLEELKKEEAETKRQRQEDLDTMLKISTCSLNDNKWENIILTEDAQRQLASLAGFIRGMSMVGEQERNDAITLSHRFVNRMRYFSSYGGEIEVQPSDGGEAHSDRGWRPIPNYKIILGQDWGFGGFSVHWYSLIDPDFLAEERRRSEHWDNFAERMKLLSARKTGHDWQRKETRWTKGEFCSNSFDFHYRFRTFGGMIYSGPGKRDRIEDGFLLKPGDGWSVHT
jgi:hypothetical protein